MRRTRIAALVAAAAVVVAGTVVLVRVTADRPDDVVRAYLEAARRGDVAGAMKAAGVEHPPSGPSAVLLDKAFLGVAWELGPVGEPYDQVDGDAEVDATITDRVTSAEGHFTLHKSGGRWRITNPFARLRVGTSPLRYAQVNGQRVQITADQTVLPGVYLQSGPAASSAGGSGGGLVRGTDETHAVAVPTSGDGIVSLPQGFAPTAAARQEFQQLSDAYLDRCLTDPSCTPLAQEDRYDTQDGSLIGQAEIQRATWHIVRRPVFDLPGGLSLAADGGPAFAGQINVPGVLRVDGTTAKGAFSSTCVLDGIGWAFNAWVDAGGTLRIGWVSGRTGKDGRIQVDCRTWT